MSSQPGYQRGDRVALVRTDDPDTRLRPGDQGTVIRWDPGQGQFSDRRARHYAGDLRVYVAGMSATLAWGCWPVFHAGMGWICESRQIDPR